MDVTLLLVVAVVLAGLVVIGVVTWLLLRPKKVPAAQPYDHGAPATGSPGPHGQGAYPGQPGQGGYPGQPGYPGQAGYPTQAPTHQYAPPSTPPAPPVPPVTPSAATAPYAPASAAPSAPVAPATPAQTWTAQVTEPGGEQVDDSEMDESTRLRENLRPAAPATPPAPPAPPTGLTPPA